METREQMNQRFLKCETLIQQIKGTFVTKYTAKCIFKLQKGGYRFSETRLNDDESLVVMERQFDNYNFGDPCVFIVKGKLGKKLNMC